MSITGSLQKLLKVETNPILLDQERAVRLGSAVFERLELVKPDLRNALVASGIQEGVGPRFIPYTSETNEQPKLFDVT